MKKACLIVIFIFVLSIPQIAYANMAAPEEADIGSSVTFEKNDALSVLSEVLNITVKGSTADIAATYHMKNTTAESVSSQAMFLSPNIETGGVEVKANGKELPFQSKRYTLDYSTEIQTDDWQYVVLTEGELTDPNGERAVDSITFQLNFAPWEEYDIVVSYTYRLGGYPDYDFNAKEGRIEYYLTPAAMWKGFENLTINLSLDEAMPVLSSSNLSFQKTGERTYQYVSDTLPEENLKIVIDENWFQTIFSTLRSPYLPMTLLTFSPFLLIALAVIIVIIWRLHKRKKRKRKAQNDQDIMQ